MKKTSSEQSKDAYMEKEKKTSSEQDKDVSVYVEKGNKSFSELFLECVSENKINHEPSFNDNLTNRMPSESNSGGDNKKTVMGESTACSSVLENNVCSLNANLKEESSLTKRNNNKLNLLKEDEIASLLNNFTLEDDKHSGGTKKNFLEIVSLSPEKSLRCAPQKKLLVINLSGILVDVVNGYYTAYKVEKRMSGKPIFKRPFCDNFLKFCFEKFNVGIWSSRRNYNVESVVDYIFGELKHKLLFCWDQSKCTDSGFKTLENRDKPLFLIELKKLWNKEDISLPWQKGDFSPSNTLLLDDTPYKSLLNPPYTAIFPKVYHHNDLGDNSFGPGGDIRVYLEQIAVTDNVQHYVKEHPFGQPAITVSSPHWNFYSQIIRRHATSESLKW